eukprot:CAMPEP_0181312942 /NCGR_PEP_ID=MMETSP1101-20121128/13975_1 /TAXON_ID=46948 /ORGANISM="Rhodomonas abbreviata, Strain Caron Lab Isolate" /LENGTH=181 /DNA_ID=CAMNT_0023419845 /DNA_START=17 /DNA_END=562 /DNA_ORIENTATION=+
MKLDDYVSGREETAKQMQPLEQKYKKKLPVSFGPLTDKIVEQLKVLNQAVCKFAYNDKFYSDVLEACEYTQLAYYSTDILVGAISCRMEKGEEGKKGKLFIMASAVLPPYRSCGVGTGLVQRVVERAGEDGEFSEVCVLVPTSDTKGVTFWEQQGFATTETIKNYYSDIDPPDSHLMSKKI